MEPAMPDGNSHIPSLAARPLAQAVIKQAMLDAVDPRVPANVRKEAEDFLSNECRYIPTAKAAGLDPKPPMTRR